MEILGSDGASRPTLHLTRGTRDALARYCEARRPVGRRKEVAREWGLTPDQARAVCEGNPSPSTIDAIWKHPRGGWSVLLPVLGAVIGTSLDQHIEGERRAHVERAEKLGTVVRALRAGPAADRGRAAERPAVGDERRDAGRRRLGG